MADSRRVKVYVKSNIYLVPGEEGLSGDQDMVRKIPKGKAALISPLQYEHFNRNGCVTKDIPESAEMAEGFE